MTAAAEPFSYLQRVSFSDIDALKHMNNVEFLRFYENARIAYFRQIVPDYEPVHGGQIGVIFAECQIAYRSPAHFEEEVRTTILPSELKRSSVRLGFEMRCEADGRLLAEGHGVIVGYDYASGRAAPFADDVRERLGATVIG